VSHGSKVAETDQALCIDTSQSQLETILVTFTVFRCPIYCHIVIIIIYSARQHIACMLKYDKQNV